MNEDTGRIIEARIDQVRIPQPGGTFVATISFEPQGGMRQTGSGGRTPAITSQTHGAHCTFVDTGSGKDQDTVNPGVEQNDPAGGKTCKAGVPAPRRGHLSGMNSLTAAAHDEGPRSARFDGEKTPRRQPKPRQIPKCHQHAAEQKRPARAGQRRRSNRRP